MMEYAFSLVPFPDPKLPDITITGTLSRDHNLLTIRYGLQGNKNDILFPNPVPRSGRKVGLWQETCFEFFVALPSQPQYWEFNLSPSGEWNAFRMDAYRRVGFRQEEWIRKPRLQIHHDADSFCLVAVVDLRRIVTSDVQIQAGVASVIRTSNGHVSYWALSHPGPQPDFHARDSFHLVLKGAGHS